MTRVASWYAQNVLVYVDSTVVLDGDDLPLRLVHPARYTLRMTQRPPLRPRWLMQEAARTTLDISLRSSAGAALARWIRRPRG